EKPSKSPFDNGFAFPQIVTPPNTQEQEPASPASPDKETPAHKDKQQLDGRWLVLFITIVAGIILLAIGAAIALALIPSFLPARGLRWRRWLERLLRRIR
ncbi:MAG: hypothetical protein AAB834_01615, partial [Patescibacteria group bacterium]